MPPVEVIRDWAIVVIAFFLLIEAIVGIFLILAIWSLVRKLNRDIGPVLESAKMTAADVRATADIVSQTVVQPFIRTAAFVAGIRRAIGVLAKFSGRRRSG